MDISTVNLIAAGLSTAATIAAAVAALLSWRAGETLSRIERDRRHGELTPALDVELHHPTGGTPQLVARLVGPPGLSAGLREVTVEIRDEHTPPPSPLTGRPTKEDIAARVWAPFRFISGIDGGDEQGRRAGPVTWDLQEQRRFQLQATTAPPWSTPRWWTDNYPADRPVRLTFHCKATDHESWDVLVDATQDTTDGDHPAPGRPPSQAPPTG